MCAMGRGPKTVCIVLTLLLLAFFSKTLTATPTPARVSFALKTRALSFRRSLLEISRSFLLLDLPSSNGCKRSRNPNAPPPSPRPRDSILSLIPLLIRGGELGLGLGPLPKFSGLRVSRRLQKVHSAACAANLKADRRSSVACELQETATEGKFELFLDFCRIFTVMRILMLPRWNYNIHDVIVGVSWDLW